LATKLTEVNCEAKQKTKLEGAWFFAWSVFLNLKQRIDLPITQGHFLL